ncbi:MAG: hypothetical protein ACLTLL_07890 [Acutalibacteraceae bacterium]
MTKYRYLVIAKQVEYDNKEKVVEIKRKSTNTRRMARSSMPTAVRWSA